MQTHKSTPEPQSGKNIPYSNYSSTSSVAGTLVFDSTSNIDISYLFTFIPLVHKNEPRVDIIDPNELALEPNADWLKLSESSFRFWENEEDAMYDSL